MHRGNISPAEAHQRLQGNSSAVLVDVRTQPEWTFVGVPAVERLVRLAWQVFPAMQVNAKFVEEIEQMGLPKDAEILCICRSGARSSSAASALTDAGYTNCWNVAQVDNEWSVEIMRPVRDSISVEQPASRLKRAGESVRI